MQYLRTSKFLFKIHKDALGQITSDRKRIYQQNDKADSALVCFSIVANRYSDNMDRHDKEMAMNGYLGRWYVYFFKFFNYENHSKVF